MTLVIVLFYSLKNNAHIFEQPKFSISNDNNQEISNSKFTFFRRGLQNLYFYMLQFEQEITAQLTSDELQSWLSLKQLLKQDSRYKYNTKNPDDGLLKLELLYDPIFFMRPEGPRMAVTGNPKNDPIFINGILVNNPREAIDYTKAIQLLIHELGHKLKNENEGHIFKIGALMKELLTSHTEEPDFKSNRKIKIIAIDSNNIPVEELPFIDKNEIIITSDTTTTIYYASLRGYLKLNINLPDNQFFKTTFLKEIYLNFKDDKLRFTFPYYNQFYFLKKSSSQQFEIDPVIPFTNMSNFALFHDLIIDLSNDLMSMHVENGTKLNLRDNFKVEYMNQKSKNFVLRGILKVENLKNIADRISLIINSTKANRIHIDAYSIEYLTPNEAKVEFRVQLNDFAASNDLQMNQISIATKSHDSRRVLLPKEIRWQNVIFKPEVPKIKFHSNKQIFNPLTFDLNLEFETDAKKPFEYFELGILTKAFFAEGETTKFNTHTPIHVFEFIRIPTENIKQIVTEKGVKFTIKVNLYRLLESKIFMPSEFGMNSEIEIESEHERVNTEIESQITYLKYVDSNLRVENIILENLNNIVYNGTAILNTKKKYNESNLSCNKLFQNN